MSELKFKSKDSFNIKSKPRLYFSCHPSDFNYFDKIAISILKQYDCVIYYNDYVDVNVDELLYQLDQMQLIIVPITRNFLLESNVALDIEFKYAVEKHIPILPLMFENRLVNIYQEKCGDTQFLDVTSNDETAISFQKKVEELFEAVILKDDMMNKVREAFDAYVFLSYRKKDRQLSQELMNLIHSDEDLRDVAIWYDEFLLPGENFNDEIKSMLSKSDLFLLLVTPNLVEENNYVMKIEYPFAKSINLPVVAVEANETDSNILKKYFEQMPSLLNFLNKKVIVESIIKNIDKISLAKDETPEHTYLIGLAYLKGIDVEVNRKKGLDLILEAANKNYINAIKEMIKIYLNGIGVEKDINKVLYWQGKLMDYYAENETTIKYSYSENSDEYINYYKEYFYDKVYYADTYGEHLDCQKCDEILLECKNLLSHFKENSELLYNLSFILEQYIIKNLKRTNRYRESLIHYSNLLDCIMKLNFNDEGVMLSYLKSKIQYGKALRIVDCIDEAISVFKEILEEYKYDDLFDIIEASEIYEIYCDLYKELGTASILKDSSIDNHLLVESFKECLRYSKEYAINITSEKSLNTFFDNYIFIANFAFLLENFNTALKIYDDCYEMISMKDDEYFKDLCFHLKGELYCKIAKIHKKQDNMELTLSYVNKSIELLNYNHNELTSLEKIELLFKKAEIYAEVDLIEEKQKALLEIFNYDLKQYPVMESKALFEISETYGIFNNYEKGLEYVSKAYEKLKMVKHSNKNFYYDMLVNCCGQITYYCCELGYDFVDSYNNGYKIIVENFMDLPIDSPFFSNSLLMDIIYYYASSRMWNEDTFNEAEELLLFCVDGYKRLQNISRGNYRNSIARVYCELFDYYKIKKDFNKALNVIEEGLSVTADNEELYDAKLKLYSKIIDYYLSIGVIDKAIKFFNLAISDVKTTIKKLYNFEIEHLHFIKHQLFLYEYLVLINTWVKHLININEFDVALSHLNTVLKLGDVLDKDNNYNFIYSDIGLTYMNVGKCYYYLGDLSLANNYFNLALNVITKSEQKDYCDKLINEIQMFKEYIK